MYLASLKLNIFDEIHHIISLLVCCRGLGHQVPCSRRGGLTPPDPYLNHGPRGGGGVTSR